MADHFQKVKELGIVNIVTIFCSLKFIDNYLHPPSGSFLHLFFSILGFPGS